MTQTAITIRRSTQADLPGIMIVYEKAKVYMRSKGNHEQWINGYPSEAVILNDMSAGNHYIGTDADGNVAFVFTFIIGEDPTYSIIEDGSWPDDKPYGTIHRIASNGLYHDVLGMSLKYCFKLIDTIRIDTHASNSPMLDALIRHGFKLCGIIHIADGSARTAFQKTMHHDTSSHL